MRQCETPGVFPVCPTVNPALATRATRRRPLL